jgi:hypothetical protein
LEAVFYKLTPHDTELLTPFSRLNPTQEAALKSNVPLYLWPAEYQPLDCRLKRWQVLDGPYEYVEGTDIPQEQLDLTKPHLALNTRIVTNAGRRVRVAGYFIERAKGLLKSPMLTMKKGDFKMMLTALGYLLADGRQLDCSNFFMDIGGDSSWNDFAEKFSKRIRNIRNKSAHGYSVSSHILDKRINGMREIMSLQEFRFLVDSSYQG